MHYFALAELPMHEHACCAAPLQQSTALAYSSHTPSYFPLCKLLTNHTCCAAPCSRARPMATASACATATQLTHLPTTLWTSLCTTPSLLAQLLAGPVGSANATADLAVLTRALARPPLSSAPHHPRPPPHQALLGQQVCARVRVRVYVHVHVRARIIWCVCACAQVCASTYLSL